LERCFKNAAICPNCDQAIREADGKPKEAADYHNLYGVPREPLEEVSLAVRQECGFGCVVCGEIPCVYDHFDPEFSDLKEEHKSSGIALLCYGHDGDRKGKPPSLSPARVRQYKDNPYCKQPGKKPHRDDFFLPPGPSGIRLGLTKIYGGATEITVNSTPVIWFKAPEPSDLYQSAQFGANLQNVSGETIVLIEDNILKIAHGGDFGMIAQGSKIEITLDGKTLLRVRRHTVPVLDVCGQPLLTPWSIKSDP
jgi:hypothetical protein